MPPIIRPQETLPRHITLQGRWPITSCATDDYCDVLSSTGLFKAKATRLEIPVAETSPANLAYYGATLLQEGSGSLTFETKVPLPIFKMRIGKQYIEGYILQDDHAGGIFLEYHDMPHFHMPVAPDAGGQLILGKKVGKGSYHLSAFAIPYRSAIYTPPGVIHNDSFLVGEWWIVYASAQEYSSVRLRDSEGNLLHTAVSSH